MSPEVLEAPGGAGDGAAQPRELTPVGPRAELSCPPPSLASPHLTFPPPAQGSDPAGGMPAGGYIAPGVSWADASAEAAMDIDATVSPTSPTVSLDAPRAYAVASHDSLTSRLSAGLVARVTQVAEPVALCEPGTMTYPKDGPLAGCRQLPTGVHGDVSEPVVPTGHPIIDSEDALRTMAVDPPSVPPCTSASWPRTSGNSGSVRIASTHEAPSSREAGADGSEFPGGIPTGPQLVLSPKSDDLALRTGMKWVSPVSFE